MRLRATILGGGAWGCAIANLLADRGFEVLVWCHESSVAQEINTTHTNTMYLRGLILHNTIKATTDLKAAASHSSLVFEAIPVEHLRHIVQSFKPYQHDHRWVILSKGIEQHSLALPSAVIEDVLKPLAIAVLVGPTFARDLIEKQFTAGVIASTDEALRNELIALLPTYYFTLFPSRDTIGVQVAGAIKNVLALAVGIAKGFGCKDNTIAYLLTMGMEELTQLVAFFGGNRDTMYGLAGLGDILLTCTGNLSKNQRAGMLLGQGKSLADLELEFGTLPEGINTAKSLGMLMEREKIFFPILAATERFIAGHYNLEQFFAAVLRIA